jgi:hypothetical protein
MTILTERRCRCDVCGVNDNANTSEYWSVFHSGHYFHYDLCMTCANRVKMAMETLRREIRAACPPPAAT